jgi:hypothetical protein
MLLNETEFRAAVLRWFGLDETVRSDASFEALKAELEQALQAWGALPVRMVHVWWTFADRLIGYGWQRQENDIYREDMRRVWEIPWSRGEDGAIVFGQPVEVNQVDLFEPVTESAPQTGKGQRLNESLEQQLMLVEATGNGARRIKAIGITADVINVNGRRYPRRVLAEAVRRLNGHLHESNGQGKLIATGEAEHPSDKGGRASILETVVKWEAASLDSTGKVLLEGAILPTSKGKDVQVLVENGVPIGVSMRGYGSFKALTENGIAVYEVTELSIRGFDLVAQPSDPNGQVVESSQADKQPVQGDRQVNEAEKQALEEAARKAAADLEEARQAQATLQAQLVEAQKAQAELVERKRAEAIERAIGESTKELKYGDALNKLFVEAVRAAKPETAEAVAGIVEAKRKEYDQIAAGATLAAMGRKGVGVQVMGPVFERETGRPEFARVAWELNEALVKRGEGHRRDVVKGDSMAEIFAAQVLERFDKMHQAKLLAESRMFEEAEQTSDLSLPYSVARMLIEQAYPELIAANVYDFGTADSSQARVHYEAYAGETGAAVAVADEAVTASTADWVSLAHNRVQPGTMVVTNSGETVTYTEGTDYVVDYEEGKILAIATITHGQSILANYTYDAIRKGEMTTIERGKNTLTYAYLNMAADRLAMEISNEAIAFSRSQLGYDAVTRTLGNLARMIRRKIDKDILYKGLAASLKQASNSGGTWTAASDDVALFAKYIGVAKSKVYNRNYVPTGIVMSVTNADRLSNWDGFKRDGFANAVLTAAGFAGSVKGLPIFASTEYPDKFVQVVHRELIAHRVYQAMTFKGPFPSYTDGKLVGAEQYYVEEFNGSMITVQEKSAHVWVA